MALLAAGILTAAYFLQRWMHREEDSRESEPKTIQPLPNGNKDIELVEMLVDYSCYFSHPSAALSWATVPCEN